MTIVGPMIAALATGCANDSPGGAVAEAQRSVVGVEVQPCANPNRHRGLGVAVDDGTILTAGHLVEGPLRMLTVEGRPATVAMIDRNADVAVLRTDLSGDPGLAWSALDPHRLHVLGRDSSIAVEVAHREQLVIEHLSDRARYRRDVVVFTPGVVEGMSGSPVVDDQGRLAGLVILNDDSSGEGIAVTIGELSQLLDEERAPDALSERGRC